MAQAARAAARPRPAAATRPATAASATVRANGLCSASAARTPARRTEAAEQVAAVGEERQRRRRRRGPGGGAGEGAGPGGGPAVAVDESSEDGAADAEDEEEAEKAARRGGYRGGGGDRGGGLAGCRRADREAQGAADRVAVGGDHAPADDLRAPRGAGRHRDQDAGVLGARGDLADHAVGAEPAEHQRAHRLVEGERDHVRRGGQHGAVGGVGPDELRVRAGGAGGEPAEQRDEGEAAHRRGGAAARGGGIRDQSSPAAAGRSVRPGAGFSSASLSWPAAGISIQPRLAVGAFLDDREVERRAGREVGGEAARNTNSS